MGTDGKHQERAPRVKIRLPLQLQIDGVDITIETEAIDVSRTGMLIATNMPLDPGAELDISVVLSDGQVLFETPGVVVRQQPDHDTFCVGIRFLGLSDSAAELIDRLGADEGHFGNYSLEALIGRGGMAEVFRGRAIAGQHMGRTVAIKRLLPSLAANAMFRDLFITEADITRTLRHPSIVEVYETGEVGDSLYIAMEFIDGGNLSQLLHACRQLNRQLPIDLACYIALRITDALDYAHNATGTSGTPLGIIHCDVAPSNIFISYAADVKLADFGVAQMRTIPGPVEGNVLVGRPQYRAPEQILFKPLSPATDIFGLGAVLYEMLTLKEAFVGKDPDEIHKKITAGEVELPSSTRPDVPADLDHVVLCALSRRIQGAEQPWWAGLLGGRHDRPRYPDAKSMAQDLCRFCRAPDECRADLRQFIASLRSKTTAIQC
jgi:serine/threonine protein kinase